MFIVEALHWYWNTLPNEVLPRLIENHLLLLSLTYIYGCKFAIYLNLKSEGEWQGKLTLIDILPLPFFQQWHTPKDKYGNIKNHDHHVTKHLLFMAGWFGLIVLYIFAPFIAVGYIGYRLMQFDFVVHRTK